MENKFILVSNESFEKLQNDISDLKALIQNSLIKGSGNKLENWITEKETMILLKTKKTTLYNLRKAGKLVSTNTRPIFYCLNSINEFLKESSK